MADWLTTWGNLGPIAGLIVAVGGFAIAIWQITRTRRAAEAAEQAVVATRASLAAKLTIADLVRASERIQEIKRLHREHEWSRALDRYHDMRIMLADVRARHPSLADEQRSTIQGAIDQLGTIEARVARPGGIGSDLATIERYDEFLLRAQSTLDELASDLQQSV